MLLDDLGTRLFHSQSVQSHGSCLNGHVHVYVQVFDWAQTFQLTFDRKPLGKLGPHQADFYRFLQIFTDFSDFLGRLHPRQT